ncbi:3beta,22alpha-dihydroxysteroid 3-dehydrogenase isoform X2 [Rosa rugosa]|uniref:3beta,22alpha-dihydroxysteroid 3-dehydrogenase isoform X2 n=1 Tax=Rosa rugosa TaxID=74645 RepID=UPI002B414A8D|nr:3beta,22alpha-dihydroxysteroid 3-dehydrogenase isoform X2 [Rosa rugosa]
MASILPPENLCFSYWAGLVVLTALTFLVYQIMKPLQYYSQQEPKVDIPPGSRGLPLIGETLHFMAAIYSGKGFYEFVRLRRLRYGKCFKTNIFGGTHVFVSSTKSAKVILNNDSGKFGKRYIKSIAELVGNQSLLCASHQHHKLLRGQLGSLFSTNSLSVFIKQFDQLIVEALKGWEHQSTVVIQDEALKITCKAMCKILLSVESGYELEVLQKEVAHVCEAMLAFPLRFPGTRFNKGLQGRKKIMSIIDKAMRERRGRRLRADEDDFLQQILRNEAGGNGLTDEEVKDNILTMVIAGQDTTATAMTWMVKFLGENPEKEQLDLWRKTSSKSFLTLESINEMPFASKVVKESLRLASIVPWFPRLALEDCKMEGFRIKKGWNVNVDAKSVHLDPTVYIDPGKFNPSRFDDEYSKGGHSRFLAFGMGGRTCLGMNMAKAMMLVFLHRLVTTYRSLPVNFFSLSFLINIETYLLFNNQHGILECQNDSGGNYKKFILVKV